MWPGLIQCSDCKIRYSLHSICPLCQERRYWAQVNRPNKYLLVGIAGVIIFAVMFGVLITKFLR